jgi:hypothetical protein
MFLAFKEQMVDANDESALPPQAADSTTSTGADFE